MAVEPPTVEEIRRKCTIVCLDVPERTHFGIDFTDYVVGPKFKGVKLIPPGPHFVYYRYVVLSFGSGLFSLPSVGEASMVWEKVGQKLASFSFWSQDR